VEKLFRIFAVFFSLSASCPKGTAVLTAKGAKDARLGGLVRFSRSRRRRTAGRGRRAKKGGDWGKATAGGTAFNAEVAENTEGRLGNDKPQTAKGNDQGERRNGTAFNAENAASRPCSGCPERGRRAEHARHGG